ncbi:hypothetical protein CYMTET_3525 [Cymbomonas tetramitiformis]|uniref:Uncharacterized protein n=1 Tax=Cymbomonas tetramitiformis TaxID=36881 RepID=A0AAE0H4Y1_9CHLO|nr:hypothetical protein CYMTET_3525 [Cymbomonas tetramitiformis]
MNMTATRFQYAATPLALVTPLPRPHVKSASAKQHVKSSRAVGFTVRSSATPEAPQGPSVPLTPSYKAASEWGLAPEEGVFGFKPFAELWVGRLAMLGFFIGLEEEFRTGNGVLAQLGLMEDGFANTPLFFTLLGLMGGASLVATTGTLIKLQRGDMTLNQFLGYAKFFGFNQEQAALAAAKKLKEEDLTLAETLSRITQEPSIPTEETTSGLSANDELAYARNVELENGRWAMMGFALTILIESATGYGTLPQLFYYIKLTGVLGADSGF